jgi:hypothetical protein
MLDNFLFENLAVVCDNVEKCGRATEATKHSTVRRRKDAIFMPTNLGKNTNTRNILFLLLHNRLIPSDLAKCLKAARKRETAQ